MRSRGRHTAYCAACGTGIDKDAKYCGSCGRRVSSEGLQDTVARARNRWIGAVVVLGLLAGALTGALFGLGALGSAPMSRKAGSPVAVSLPRASTSSRSGPSKMVRPRTPSSAPTTSTSAGTTTSAGPTTTTTLAPDVTGGTTVPSESTTTSEPTTTQCGSLSFAPGENPEAMSSGAQDIVATGTDCLTAQDVAGGAETAGGTQYEVDGFTCVPGQYVVLGLGYWPVTCTNGTATITFDAGGV